MNPMEQSSAGLTLRNEKGPDARNRILSAAISLFAMKGFEGVSTTQIAKAAGITQPLIHYHFKNKQALWKAAATRLFKQLDTEFTQVIQQLPQQDRQRFIIETLRNYIAFCSRHPEFGQFIMREGAQQTERLEWLVNELVRPFQQEFYDLYLEGVAEGWLKPIPFPQLIMMVSASASHFFSLSPLVKTLYNIEPLTAEQALLQSDVVVEMVISSIFKNLEEKTVSARAMQANTSSP
ncbi:MAG: hypothetical protein CSA49_02400 [Gammaproteobacteria bacterium]|nr:MAG: hypothetical protein CSA49_02400 [Gammaproteobacteria bacterium]